MQLDSSNQPIAYWKGLIHQYASFLPVTADTPVISLHEGNTPLIKLDRFVSAIGGDFDLYLKFEGLNPTASFKDRGMTMAITKAVEKGAEVVICASTGNTSASAAAYAARANLKCVVLLPDGNIAMGKLAQALMYGAQTIAIRGNFDQALDIVRQLGETGKVEIVDSINPFRIEGQKTASFEICDQLGRAPDYHFLPVGNAGNITAYWKGYREYEQAGRVKGLPHMCGYQAAGSAPIVDGHPITAPETLATAIRIGNPASWQGALDAMQQSSGWIDKVTDEAIVEAYKLVANTEGIFVEPACAAPLAGLIASVRANRIPAGSLITATMTGHGLKDPDRAISCAAQKPDLCDANLDSVSRLIGL